MPKKLCTKLQVEGIRGEGRLAENSIMKLYWSQTQAESKKKCFSQVDCSPNISSSRNTNTIQVNTSNDQVKFLGNWAWKSDPLKTI